MCRRIAMAVLRLSLVAAVMTTVAKDAEAGCKNLPPYLCASWIKGTLFCDNVLKGVAAQLAKNCNPEQPETCPLVTECTVFGTIGGSAACTDPTVPPDPTTACEIKGNLRCLNPNGHFNDQGTAFIAGPISEAAGSTTCTKGGKCVNEAEVQPSDALCPGPSQTGGSGNWTVDFTPDEFKGKVCVCPGGFDANNTCCADANRTDAGTCSKVYGDGTPGCVTEFCSIDPNAPKGTVYSCNIIQ